MSEIEPITREEVLLNSIAEGTGSEIEPITRKEMYLSAIAGETELPADMNPITREEIFLQKVLDNGAGGGEAEGTVSISITQNGTITRNVARYASAEITTNVPNPSTGTKQISSNGTHDVTDFASAEVSVPNSYTSSDEGKVVSDGALVSQTNKQVMANGTYDTTLNDSVEVNVPTGITPTGTKQISVTANGTTTEDVTNYASAEITVNVPNSYTASDEGKVVSSGALVSQSSQTVTENGTYDTTLKNEVVVNVSGSGDSYAEDYKAVLERTAVNPTLPSDLTTIGAGAFASCANLTTIVLPSGVTSIGSNAFRDCTNLTSISIPSGVTGAIGNYTFQNDTNLPLIDLPSGVTSIGTSAFNGCNALATMILRRSDGVCALSNVNALQNTPIRGYNSLRGTVYVPSALIESYKAASNWSTIFGEGAVEFVAIERSVYDD